MYESDRKILTILEQGEITVRGEFIWGSNYTFLAEIRLAEETIKGVYKPTRGERPLWDFPRASLARREAAAYLVSEALGWRLVPPTLYRKKAPAGAGSLQFYIEHDPEYHYFTFSEEDTQRLRPTVLFDILINNADRKGSHVLIGEDGHLWCIDHGVCFHVEDKLRTVIWDFAGEPIPPELCSVLENFIFKIQSLDGAESDLAQALTGYLHPAEVKALAARAQALLQLGHFPAPDLHRRQYPWPQI